MMKRFYYANSVSNFLVDTQESILGTLTSNGQFDVTNSQRDVSFLIVHKGAGNG